MTELSLWSVRLEVATAVLHDPQDLEPVSVALSQQRRIRSVQVSSTSLGDAYGVAAAAVIQAVDRATAAAEVEELFRQACAQVGVYPGRTTMVGTQPHEPHPLSPLA
jgi:hypothetical protein